MTKEQIKLEPPRTQELTGPQQPSMDSVSEKSVAMSTISHVRAHGASAYSCTWAFIVESNEERSWKNRRLGTN